MSIYEENTMSTLREENIKVEPKSKSEIDNELDFLNRSINSLEDNVVRLSNLLEKILKEEYPQKTDNEARAIPNSLLGKIIYEKSNKIFYLSDQLNQLEERIAL